MTDEFSVYPMPPDVASCFRGSEEAKAVADCLAAD